jgi:hypothetical protein
MRMNGRIFFVAALLSGSLLPSCTSKPAAPEATQPAPAAKAATTSSYACPMGCQGSESTKPGQCPVCGMDLEKKS